MKNGSGLAAKIALSLAVFIATGDVEAKSPEKVNEPLKPGMAAPVFRLYALDGALLRLDELAYPGREKSYAKKRPIILDFFRTDCEPCKNAIADLVKLATSVQTQGIDVVLVALLEHDNGRAKLESFLQKNKLPMKVVVDDQEHFAKKYLGDPVTLPATFLIDENGTVVKTKYGSGGTYEAHFGAEIAQVVAARKKGAAK